MKLLNENGKLVRAALIILALATIGYVIIAGRDFIYPICLGILLSYLVYPVVNFLEKYIKIKILATLISVIIAVIVLSAAIFFIYTQLSDFLGDFSELRKQASKNFDLFNQKVPFLFDSESGLKDVIQNILGAQQNFLNKILTATTGTLVGLGLQPVYVYFMLYYRHHFRAFFFDIVESKHHNKLKTILKEVSTVTNNYVSGVFIVVLILCLLNTLGLTIIGVKYALMFGIISAVMNFIPYFGTLIGGAIPLLYTLVSPEPEKAVGVLILFVIIQFTENNILTPTITGGRVAINPLFTIFTIIIGGLAWGIPGMFIFVPFVGMIKVVFEHIEPLKPFAKVISPENPDRPSPVVRWFKKVFSS